MKIKLNTVEQLVAMGIDRTNAEKLQGAQVEPTKWNGQSFIQVEFAGEILGLEGRKVYCIPREALEL